MLRPTLILTCALSTSTPTYGFCARWGAPRVIGELDRTVIAEASGLAVSRGFDDRHYHVNDSGDGPRVYVTSAAGVLQQRFEIASFAPTDVEDLGYGACPDTGHCLYVADVGDNDKRRSGVSVLVVGEQETYPATVGATERLELRYPDGAHDAEGFAVHPDGDLYLLTKEFSAGQ